MKTIKFLALSVVVLLFTSCNFDINLGQTNGNGNVVTQDRIEGESFDEVRGSAGLDVFLTEGAETKVTVEADENLQEIIETRIDGGKLIITTNANIGRSVAKKVYVTYTGLKSIEASSGADVIGNSVIKSESLNLDASSGADLEVEIFSKEVFAETSSGADIKVTGKASSLRADASSGSDLNAKNLIVATCNAEASSGADITVNVKDKLTASASSGGDINYYGNPSAVNNKSSRSGGLNKM
ncbi:head GIN domain-containing protein [Patiriisocius hiemis]|uniref:Head GIN domain-containing protein n=1 Tax=Patiriisocius hiemis TaxID=3075604 RepID=A0ABU2YEY4_9FLAO|nr:head GIN domain-containing protein [Constantimarinum sp. W242]MDT0556572.1 head GIN domain-containing protein [Constantimarinum sp. W242]